MGARLLGRIGDGQHVPDGHPVGDDDQQFDAGGDGLQRRRLDDGRRDIEDRHVQRPGLFPCLLDGVEYRHPFDFLAALAWGDAGHDLGAVFAHELGAGHAFAPGDALNENSFSLVNQYGHALFLASDSCLSFWSAGGDKPATRASWQRQVNDSSY